MRWVWLWVLAGGVAAAVAALVLFGRLRFSLCLAVERGGLWLRIRTALGPLAMVELQFRWQPGRAARLWLRGPVGRLRPLPPPPWVDLWNQRGTNLPLSAAQGRQLLDLLTVEQFSVRARLGVQDDAAATALLCGALNALLLALDAVLLTRGALPFERHVDVLPDFSKRRCSVRLRCIATLQIRHSIPVALESLTGRKHNERSSDRKHDGNHIGEHTQHG